MSEKKTVCGIAVKAALDMLKDMCDETQLFRELATLLGVSEEDLDKLNPPSEHCKAVLESLDEKLCRDFRGQRSWVMCRAWELMDSGMTFREAIRTAWAELREKCAKMGIIV